MACFSPVSKAANKHVPKDSKARQHTSYTIRSASPSVLHLSYTSDSSGVDIAVPDAADILRGLGDDRVVHRAAVDELDMELQQMAGPGAIDDHEHSQHIREWLHERRSIFDSLQHLHPEEVAEIQEAAYRMEPIVRTLLIIAAPLLLIAWIFWYLHSRQTERSEHIPYSFVIFLIAMALALPHYRMGFQALGRH